MALHPQARDLVAQFSASGAPPLYEQPVEQAREMTAALAEIVGEGAEMHESRSFSIPVSGGDIPAHLHRPVAEPDGTIVYFHGGGWVLGNSTDIAATLQLLARASNCDVVGVDYRLAPEHTFPTAVDDAYDACVWIVENMADGNAIGVAGESAGGNLTAVTAIRARDRKGFEMAAQVLFYPVTDGRMESESYETYGDAGLLLGRREMDWFWDLYARDTADRLSPEASPLLAEDLRGLPAALVIVAEYDPLRDEVRAYAEKLRAAGVDVTTSEYEDMFHGFGTMPNVLERGNEVIDAAGRFLRDRLRATSV